MNADQQQLLVALLEGFEVRLLQTRAGPAVQSSPPIRWDDLTALLETKRYVTWPPSLGNADSVWVILTELGRVEAEKLRASGVSGYS